MQKLFCTILIIGLTSCSYDYMSIREQKQFRNNRHTFETVNQTKQIREKHQLFAKDPTHVIYIQEVVAKKKAGEGIYAYNFSATHFGRANFFLYKDSIVTLLDRTSLDSLQNTTQLFLIDNNFNNRKIKRAKTRIKKIWNINSTDSF